MDVLYYQLNGKFCFVKRLIVLLVFIFITATDVAFSGEIVKDTSSLPMANQALSENYKEKLARVKVEMEKVGRDLDWLELKIKKMEAFNRNIPKKMVDSVELKKSKISALNKIKKSLENRIQRHDEMQKPDFKSGLDHQLKKTDLKHWMEFEEHTKAFKLVNRLPILFASGKADISKEYKTVLKNLAALVKNYDVRIVVNGYTDKDPIHTHMYPSNFELGSARAANVVHVLEEYGVKPSVFKIGSTGQYRFTAQKASKSKMIERHVDISVFFSGS